MKRMVLAFVCLGALAGSACARRPKSSGQPDSAQGKGPLCSLVSATLLPIAGSSVGPGKWSVELPVDGLVLKTHEARFARLHIVPNGEAWAGLLEQCLAKDNEPLGFDVHLDPEASSLHAWVESDRSKDQLVAAMCRAVDDVPWLEKCLVTVDRSKLDD